MLQSGDVAVVDLFGKIEGGTFVGDKLAYYIQKTTGTGLVVDGALFYLIASQQTGMPAYYRGTHPGSLTNVMLTGVNVPVRIGDAIVMPGDIVLGDRDGISSSRRSSSRRSSTRRGRSALRDEWVKTEVRHRQVQVQRDLRPADRSRTRRRSSTSYIKMKTATKDK